MHPLVDSQSLWAVSFRKLESQGGTCSSGFLASETSVAAGVLESGLMLAPGRPASCCGFSGAGKGTTKAWRELETHSISGSRELALDSAGDCSISVESTTAWLELASPVPSPSATCESREASRVGVQSCNRMWDIYMFVVICLVLNLYSDFWKQVMAWTCRIYRR